MYGKGTVWLWVQHLCKALGINCYLVDDEDGTDSRMSIAESANRIVATPGIPPSHTIYQVYGHKVMSELNRIGLILNDYDRRNQSIKIGITGTKGKSTTTRMTYHLAVWLIPTATVHLAGNFKVSLSEVIATIMESSETDRRHIFVIECSSFMLYHLDTLFFDYSIWTNFSPDHLNRHYDLDDYFRAKACIISHTKQVCLTNESIIRQRNSIDGQTSCLLECYRSYESLDQTCFLGAHNALNLWSSVQLIEHLTRDIDCTYDQSQLWVIISAIPPLDHRLQLYAHIDGIAIYDDNNSTNSSSLETALKSFENPVILICWGSDKWDSFGHLKELFSQKIAHACLIGTMSPIFADLCQQADVSYTLCDILGPAIDEAFSQAKQKHSDTILFSPWCASFDQYANYHERAKEFTSIIDMLSKE